MSDLKIFAQTIEDSAKGQIDEMAAQSAFADAKIRIMPDVHSGCGCVIGFTANLGDKVIPNVVGVDLGCLDKDTEILTPSGWVKISQYSDRTPILQYDPETDTATFIIPQKYIVLSCDEFNSFQTRNLDMLLSDEHKMIVWKISQKRSKPSHCIFSAKEMSELLPGLAHTDYYRIKKTFTPTTSPLSNLSDDSIRLDVAIAADGCIKYESGNKHQVYFHLKKERKIERLEFLLSSLKIKYKKTVSKVNGSTHIYFLCDKSFNKDLSKYFMASQHQLSIIAEECLKWDGHIGYRSFFVSNDKTSADIIQYALSSSGKRAEIYTFTYPDHPNWHCTYEVIPTRNEFVALPKNVARVKSEDGKKYCFTTTTGFFVARRNGKIFITGNCGMLATKIAEKDVDFKQLDDTIKKVVPAGFNVHEQEQNTFIALEDLVCFPKLSKISWIKQSMGTLGGGNHFIELDKASDGSYWLVIHSGSRNLGKQVASIYQDIAIQDCSFADTANEEIQKAISSLKAAGRVTEIGATIVDIKKKYDGLTKLPKELCYVTGKHREEYLHDMRLAQQYAVHNREEMANTIIKTMGWHIVDRFVSVHNFIGDDNIIRKGSIAAYKGDRVIIPLNMRDGSVIGIGKGNPDWNYSAPHGAGRLMSRGNARHSLKLDDFTDCMQGIYTTTADASTIDEAPMAYKNAQEIISQLDPTVDVVNIIKPVYNFKASDNEEDRKPWQK